MYIIICETDLQSRFNAWDKVLRASGLGWPWGMGWGGRWERGAGWGTHVHPWLIHVNVWQKPLQYCKVISLQLNKLLSKKKNSAVILNFVAVYAIKSKADLHWQLLRFFFCIIGLSNLSIMYLNLIIFNVFCTLSWLNFLGLWLCKTLKLELNSLFPPFFGGVQGCLY